MSKGDVLNRREVRLYGRLCSAGLDPDYAEVKARKNGHRVTEHSVDHVAEEIIEGAEDRWFENGSAPSGSGGGGSGSSSSGRGDDFYDRIRREARKEFGDRDDDEDSGW